jgi:flagellar hook assembly protein FlgD
MRPYRNSASSTAIHVELALAGPLGVDIYDVSGRLARRVHDGNAQRGLHLFDWDGIDGHRQVVASGTYFVRLSRNGGTMTRRLMLMR